MGVKPEPERGKKGGKMAPMGTKPEPKGEQNVTHGGQNGAHGPKYPPRQNGANWHQTTTGAIRGEQGRESRREREQLRLQSFCPVICHPWVTFCHKPNAKPGRGNLSPIGDILPQTESQARPGQGVKKSAPPSR